MFSSLKSLTPIVPLLAATWLGGCDVTAPANGMLETAVPAKQQVALAATGNGGKFMSSLDLGPQGCEASGKCKLGETLAYVDSRGVGWEAEKGNMTDGASIPGWAKPFVGQSFDESFIKAAVIHDHYCDRHVRPWPETHWVFYDALRASNVPEDKAKLMYFAVVTGGPKWQKLDQAKTCATGGACQKVIPEMFDSRSTLQTKGKTQLLVRKQTFDDPRFSVDMKKAEELIAKNPNITLEELEALARKQRPGDFYLNKS